MKKALRIFTVLLLLAASFIAGVLYTVYNADITWGYEAETTMTIYLHGFSWDFPAYNGP